MNPARPKSKRPVLLSAEAALAAQSPVVPSGPPRALPAEFDALLVRTDDHGAIQGIEASLRRAKISAFRDHDGAIVGRTIGLFIRSADLPLAIGMRDEVFKRRAKFKSYPRQDVRAFDVVQTPPRLPGGW